MGKLAWIFQKKIKGKETFTLLVHAAHIHAEPLVPKSPGLVEIHDPTLPIQHYTEFPKRNPCRKGSGYHYAKATSYQIGESSLSRHFKV